MSETATNLSIKEKIRAFQQLETTLGKTKTSLNKEQRIERKYTMRSIFLEENFILRADPRIINIIIIHELYHKYGQNMNPNMVEVKHLRDHFGEQTITEMDIDSDIETFLFFRDAIGMGFREYLAILYSQLYKSTNSGPFRIPKMMRFIGSLLSIYSTQMSGLKQILTPNLAQIGDEQCYLACITNGRKFAKVPSVMPLINIHMKIKEFTEEQFIDQVVSFCDDIFNYIRPQLMLK